MSIKDDECVTTKWCFACLKKGALLVKMSGKCETHNIINWCRNPECFRYIEKIPLTWKHKPHEIHTVPKSFIRDSREPDRPERQPDAENQANQAPAMDRKSATIPGMEGSRTGLSVGYFERERMAHNGNKKPRRFRETIEDDLDFESEDGYLDSVEG